jgi:hypothetical protein
MRRPILAGALLFAIVWVTGCGPSLKPVTGVVKLDGNPVEGATVSFISDDGKNVFTGFTDSSGSFKLANSENKAGVVPGNYKVTVVKRPSMGGEAMMPGSPEYMKHMEKEGKEASKHQTKGGFMPGMPRPGAGGVMGGEKSELPSIYSSASTTTLTVTVPPPSQPVVLELKSKP